MSNALKLAIAAAGQGSAGGIFIEDVFSTQLWPGTNDATLKISNGIDFVEHGGMAWMKDRTAPATARILDTLRNSINGNHYLVPSTTDAEVSYAGIDHISSFDVDGLTLGDEYNYSGSDFVAWCFRSCPGFFAHQEVTKAASSDATVDFSDLSTLGMVAIKRLDSTGDWFVWHRSLTVGKLVKLNATDAEATLGHITVSGTTVTLEDGVISDGDYVVYAWAHDVQNFGASSDESIAQSGVVTTGAGGVFEVDCGWEAQWLLIKPISEAGSWFVFDAMRGWTEYATSGDNYLLANSSNAEASTSNWGPTATGFKGSYGGAADIDLIYTVVRRPMKPPANAGEVFSIYNMTSNGDGSGGGVITGAGFPPDLIIGKGKSGGGDPSWFDRLRGPTNKLNSASTAAESAETMLASFDQDGFTIGANGGLFNPLSNTAIAWMLRRAPGFMDVRCYDGDDAADRAVNHNLVVPPELYIIKNRSRVSDWAMYHKDLTGHDYYMRPNGTQAEAQATGVFGGNAPTASVFYVDDTGNTQITNHAGDSYIAILFASLAGISKVGLYTGTGADLTVNCGFSNGAAFVLIKRIDVAGDNWHIFDSARGIVAGNDGYLVLNGTQAENTLNDYIDPHSNGFIITSGAPAALNAVGGKYIFLAIAAE